MAYFFNVDEFVQGQSYDADAVMLTWPSDGGVNATDDNLHGHADPADDVGYDLVSNLSTDSLRFVKLSEINPVFATPDPVASSTLAEVSGYMSPSTTASGAAMPDTQRRFKCSLCKAPFEQMSHLKRHTRYSCPQAKEVISTPCPVRSKSFCRPDYVLRHIRRVHERRRLVACHICKRVFSRRSALDAHTEKAHTKHRSLSLLYATDIVKK